MSSAAGARLPRAHAIAGGNAAAVVEGPRAIRQLTSTSLLGHVLRHFDSVVEAARRLYADCALRRGSFSPRHRRGE